MSLTCWSVRLPEKPGDAAGPVRIASATCWAVMERQCSDGAFVPNASASTRTRDGVTRSAVEREEVLPRRLIGPAKCG